MLEKSATFILDADTAPGDEKRVHLPHPEILSALEPGHRLILDDGKLRLIVEAHLARGGDHQGARRRPPLLAQGRQPAPPPSPVSAAAEKDRADAEVAAEVGVDWIALSFVQRPEDLAELRKIVQGRALGDGQDREAAGRGAAGGNHRDASDAIMVARGDLGVEMPIEKVPGHQKRMIRMARAKGKPVVVATADAGKHDHRPGARPAPRSRTSRTAVFEGADAVMLSAESAAGQYPIEAVSMMNRIAEEVEGESVYRSILEAQRTEPEATGADAIAKAAHEIAEALRSPRRSAPGPSPAPPRSASPASGPMRRSLR